MVVDGDGGRVLLPRFPIYLHGRRALKSDLEQENLKRNALMSE